MTQARRATSAIRLSLILAATLTVAGCGAKSVWAPDDAVAKAAYRSDKPPSVTLFTVISTSTGSGGHSALMINGSQRVIFDPAGSWYHPRVPERNDVDFGITEQMYKFYIQYHARKSYFVREQRVDVSLAQADAMIRAAEAQGPTPQAFCASSVSSVLDKVPGFGSISHTYFPVTLSDQFAALPGVTAKDHYSDDPDDNSGVLMVEAQTPAQ